MADFESAWLISMQAKVDVIITLQVTKELYKQDLISKTDYQNYLVDIYKTIAGAYGEKV